MLSVGGPGPASCTPEEGGFAVKRLIALISLAAAATLVAPTSALASGGPPSVSTDTQQAVTATVPFGDGMVTVTFNSVFHVTAFADGSVHVNGNQTGTFFFVPNDPTLLTSTGHYSEPFSFTVTANTYTETDVFNVHGQTTDGSPVCIRTRFHITVVDGVQIVLDDVSAC